MNRDIALTVCHCACWSIIEEACKLVVVLSYVVPCSRCLCEIIAGVTCHVDKVDGINGKVKAL